VANDDDRVAHNVFDEFYAAINQRQPRFEDYQPPRSNMWISSDIVQPEIHSPLTRSEGESTAFLRISTLIINFRKAIYAYCF
jgi:hypothetical protein